MFKHCALSVGLALTALASEEFQNRCFQTLCESNHARFGGFGLDEKVDSLIQEMESTRQCVMEEQKILEELKKEAQKRAEQGSKPLSKKQRRLQYVNELLSHNSDLKKQSLIKVINNLNKCGVECTLSTQGKGSHITLSVDGKKHTISSKMEMTHLRDALSDSGVQFSVIEDENGQSESDQIIQDQTLKVDELTQLLNTLGVDVAELEKEKEKLEEELENHVESVEESFDALLFYRTVELTVRMIVHRSFGRREMIWKVYEAVLAHLLFFGPQLDFQLEVKKRLLWEKDQWGSTSCGFVLTRSCLTTALDRQLHYFDTVALYSSHFSLRCPHCRYELFFDAICSEIFSFNIREVLDAPEQFYLNHVYDSVMSYHDRYHKKPNLRELKEILNDLRDPNGDSKESIQRKQMFQLMELFEQEHPYRRDPKYKSILDLTDANPIDDPWYEETLDRYHDICETPFVDLMKISELYDRCHCKMAQAWFDLAFYTLAEIWERDKNNAVLFIERMLDQTPFQRQDPRAIGPFGTYRRNCAIHLYDQTILKFQRKGDFVELSEECLIDIERAEMIYGDGWFTQPLVFQLDLSVSCLRIGDLKRAARHFAKVSDPTRIPRKYRMEFERLGFDPKSKEVSRECQKWGIRVNEEKRRMRKERIRELVVLAGMHVSLAQKTWDERDELDLEQIEQNHQQLRAVRNEMKDCVECAIDHPDLLRELKDKDELYQKCVAFKKGEHSPKKKKTQKRGKHKKH